MLSIHMIVASSPLLRCMQQAENESAYWEGGPVLVLFLSQPLPSTGQEIHNVERLPTLEMPETFLSQVPG